ncbi:MAG TPA: DinB family protein [Candidatus Angelobacter sp.]|nr:DinB family protein [Candidatus Angelobacter sp.]
MKSIRMFCLLSALTFAITAMGQTSGTSSAPASAPAAQQSSQPAPTVGSTVDKEISAYEKLMVDAADAMPEDKFNFTPASLNIPGSSFKDVRTFAQLIKHTAAANYLLWSRVSGEKMPGNIKGGNGPEELKSKAEIMQLLKDSFAAGHRAAKTLTAENMMEQIPFRNDSAPRLFVATFGVIHDGDEYGQMVEYLRMNGIVPPASRH